MITDHFDSDLDARYYAGEPLLVEYQPLDANDVIENVAGRSFVLTVFRPDRSQVTAVAGVIVSGADRHFSFAIDGGQTDQLVSIVGLRYELAEVIAAGRDVVASGRLIVTASARAPLAAPAGDATSGPVTRFTRHIVANSPRLIVSQRGARGLSFSQELGTTAEDLLQQHVTAPVAAAVEQVDDAITELGEATSAKFGEIDVAVAGANSAASNADTKAALADNKANLADQKATAAQAVVEAGAQILTARNEVEIFAGQAAANATALDTTDALADTMLFAFTTLLGLSPVTTDLDGMVDIPLLRADNLDGFRGAFTSLVLRTSLGVEAGRQLATEQGSGGGLIWALALNDALPIALNDDGTIDIDALRAELLDAQRLTTARLVMRNALGVEAGALEVSDTTDLIGGTASAGGNLPFAINPDGSIEMIWDEAARFSENAVVDANVVLLTRAYAYNRRHVYAYWQNGQTYKLTADDTADHSILGFDSASGQAVIARRIGDDVRRYTVSASGNAPALRPVVSARDIFLIGDSYVQTTLLNAIYAAFTDKSRSMTMSGSGGSWLDAHLAVLAGPADPINGGVVPASHVGSVPTRNGGAAQTGVIGRIDNGAGATGNVLTVTALSSGQPVQAGQQVIIPNGGLTVGTPPSVLAFGTNGMTGTGGVGTYALSGTNKVADGATIYLGPWRYPGVPQVLGRTVIIMDGGLDDAGDGAAAIIARIQAMGAIQTPLVKRWFYVQSGLSRLSTPAQVAAKLALDAQIQAAIGWHFVPTYDWMRSHGTGSTVGANGGGVWAADNYGDDIHPSTPDGQGNLATCIANYIEAGGN